MKSRGSAPIVPPVAMDCPYCGGKMIRRNSRYGLFYGCSAYPKCGATVGCHPNGKPLGAPADRELKDARMAAHAAFDKLWQGKISPARSAAYLWLAEQLGIPYEDTHIAMFDVATCKRVVEACKAAPLQIFAPAGKKVASPSQPHEGTEVGQ